MKDEIKEILKDSLYNGLTDENYKLLLDYITNLQEENKRLNDELKRLNDLLNSQAYQDLDNYKSRIDKAIEYINAGKTFNSINVGQVVNKIQNDLLNILEGSDKE